VFSSSKHGHELEKLYCYFSIGRNFVALFPETCVVFFVIAGKIYFEVLPPCIFKQNEVANFIHKYQNCFISYNNSNLISEILFTACNDTIKCSNYLFINWPV